MAKYDLIAVYIMASRRNGTLYVGVTSDLISRVHQHRLGNGASFAAKYGCTRLVWWEPHADMVAAIAREKELKRVTRKGKLALVEATNPPWRDLYEDFLPPPR
ncbi:MAG: GIY-YIG nuclease family protein [Alphaproteobacteria bacterium]|nr:GIY-YIG nuclease family protein [Alphaproteobacteria bacterium]